jgi:hypothetical protein
MKLAELPHFRFKNNFRFEGRFDTPAMDGPLFDLKARSRALYDIYINTRETTYRTDIKKQTKTSADSNMQRKQRKRSRQQIHPT